MPDIAGDALAEEADQQGRRHALIAAAFAEVSADSGRTVPDVLTGFSEAFRQHAGQLRNQGEFSLESLLAGAREIAERRGILTDIGEALDGVIAGLNEGVSEVPSQAAFDPEAYDRAMVALDDLDYYLNEAGIDESGTFVANEAHQVNWLFQPEMVGLIESTLKTAMASAMASVMAGVYQDIPGAPTEPLDLSSFIGGSSSNLNALYDFGTQTLTVTGTANGQTHDIIINIDPITSDSSILNYSIQGTASIENGTALGELEGNLEVNLYDTDLEPVMTALQSSLMESGDGSDLEQALMDLLPDLHVRGTVTGQGSLVKTGDTDFGFAINDVSAWGELNMPALQEGGDLLAMEITTGELISPDGDRIAHNPATAAPALAVQVGQHAHLQTDFRAEAFGLPPMRVRADGSLDNIGTLVETVAGKLADLDTSSLNVSDLTGLFAGLDYSVLALDGSGQLRIEDPGERGLRTYEFTLDGTRLDASLPNSTEQALSFYLTGLNGGYIYAGDTLVATVTFDWRKLGATLHFVDGSQRSYFLGPLSDIIDPAALEALRDFLS